jgi:hypothetical protein
MNMTSNKVIGGVMIAGGVLLVLYGFKHFSR